MSSRDERRTVRRGGRRPGPSGPARRSSAAARHFAQHGYDRASLRGIAAEAGVDQKLIAHFFGSKQQLFVAAVGLPFNPGEVLPPSSPATPTGRRAPRRAPRRGARAARAPPAPDRRRPRRRQRT